MLDDFRTRTWPGTTSSRVFALILLKYISKSGRGHASMSDNRVNKSTSTHLACAVWWSTWWVRRDGHQLRALVHHLPTCYFDNGTHFAVVVSYVAYRTAPRPLGSNSRTVRLVQLLLPFDGQLLPLFMQQELSINMAGHC